MELINFGGDEYYVEKFGSNIDVDTAYETIWDDGDVYTFPSSAESLEIVAAQAADTSIVVEVQGLDASYNLQTESVTTNASDGTTAVAITGTWLRVFRAKVTSGTTTGNLTIRVASAGATRAVIRNAFYQTTMAIYTIPANYTARLTSYYLTVEKAADAVAALFIRPFGEVFQLKHQISVFESYVNHRFETPLQLNEKDDIDLRAISSAVNTSVYGGFSLLLKDTNSTSGGRLGNV